MAVEVKARIKAIVKLQEIVNEIGRKPIEPNINEYSITDEDL